MKKYLVLAEVVTLVITGVSLVVFIASVMLGWFHIGYLVNLIVWMTANVIITVMANNKEYDYVEAEVDQPKKRSNLKYRKIEG